MSEDGVEGIGLCEAIEQIRRELLAARASGQQADVRLPVTSVTVELRVIATQERGGEAGFKVPLADVKLGGSASQGQERISTVTVEFGAPTDAAGEPVSVAEGRDDLMG